MKKEKRTNIQVEGFIFKKIEGTYKFLILKRVPERGGFWQPLTGGVHVGETRETGLRREVGEETGIHAIIGIIPTDYSFSFNDRGIDCDEYIYGVEVPSDANVRLSDEHDSFKWVDVHEVIPLLKWAGNIEGFEALCKELDLIK